MPLSPSEVYKDELKMRAKREEEKKLLRAKKVKKNKEVRERKVRVKSIGI